MVSQYTKIIYILDIFYRKSFGLSSTVVAVKFGEQFEK